MNDVRFNTVPMIQSGYRIQPKQGFFQRNLFIPQQSQFPNWARIQNAAFPSHVFESGLQGQLANTGFHDRVQYKTIPSSFHTSDFYAGAPSESILTNGLHALAGLASSQPTQQFNLFQTKYHMT